MDTDHLCIGGGPAGIYAALTAVQAGKRCMIVEPNESLGRKLRITGKGRCNVTNLCDRDTLFASIPGNPKFLYSAMADCPPEEVMEYFESIGVPLKVERGNRVFPVSDRAEDVVQALTQAVRRAGISVVRGKVKALRFHEDGSVAGVTLTNRMEIDAKTVLIATGGKSYPRTGSDGSGYDLAKQAGHSIVPPMPSLVPLVTEETWCKYAMNLSLKNVVLKLFYGEKCIYKELGEMMFTHFGVSGPLILTASTLMRKGNPKDYRLEINLKPGLTAEKLDQRIQRDLAENQNRDMGTILRKLLPAKLILPVLQLCQIAPDTKGNSLKKQQRQKLVQLIQAVPLQIKEFRPLDEAIVTRGGVNIKEVNAKTMESKLCPNLYFAGEILDVDAVTGGFNLQIAFATGKSAGLHMREK